MDMEMHLRNAPGRVILIRNLVDKAELRAKVVGAVRELQEGTRSG